MCPALQEDSLPLSHEGSQHPKDEDKLPCRKRIRAQGLSVTNGSELGLVCATTVGALSAAQVCLLTEMNPIKSLQLSTW